MTDVDGRDLDGFSDAARGAVAAAGSEATELDHDLVGTEHLLLGLSSTAGEIVDVLGRHGATLAATRRKVQEARPATPARRRRGSTLDMTPRAARALVRAVRFAHQSRSHEVEPVHLLLAVVDVEGTASLVLRGLGVDLSRLRAELEGGASDASAAALGRGAATTSAMAPPPTCPACRAPLIDAIHAHSTHATDDGGRHEHVEVYACATCGCALGVRQAAK